MIEREKKRIYLMYLFLSFYTRYCYFYQELTYLQFLLSIIYSWYSHCLYNLFVTNNKPVVFFEIITNSNFSKISLSKICASKSVVLGLSEDTRVTTVYKKTLKHKRTLSELLIALLHRYKY